MKATKQVLLTFAAIAVSSSALANKINWGERSYKISYGTIIVGAVTAGTGAIGSGPSKANSGLGGALLDGSAEATFIVAGGAVAAVGGAMLVGNIVSDVLSDSELTTQTAAEHRALVLYAHSLLQSQNSASLVDPNFDSILAQFECQSCTDDTAKAKKLAELILAADQLGQTLASASKEELKQGAVDQAVAAKTAQILGTDSTDKNIKIAAGITAGSIVNIKSQNK
ncbi:MAG: hypothetical protein ACOYOK_15420 [Pseudobdellovibrionaceae bacterium]